MFYGREDILTELMTLWGKRVSSLVTCRGRRRVGKSTLIEKFAEKSDACFIRLEGLRPKPGIDNSSELASFAEQLSRQTGCEDTPPSNWTNAFARLDREIPDHGRTVVLLDEISWMAFDDVTFAGTLKIAWDGLFKKHPRLVLVVCGSVSSWIRENIIDDGSFFGRRSLDIVVPELPLADCVKFWGKAAGRIDAREIIDVLSVTGGVPRYLEEIDPGASANENIRRLCFRPKSILREDFDEMFQDVITKQQNLSGKVLRALVGGSKSVAELAVALEMEKSGHFTSVLDQLSEAGLVAPDSGKNPATGEDSREQRYRLKDNYSRFYLKYIEPVKAVIDRGSFTFGSLEALDGWPTVMGYAFENLVVNNVSMVIPLLGLGAAQVVSAAPYRRNAPRKSGGEGVQVDLLVQTRRALCVVEIKRRREIGVEIIDEMIERVKKVPRPAGMSVRTALIYEGQISPAVEADGYFDALVPFRNLMGL